MINRLSVTTIWVKNLNEALQFYTETLGFEIRTDISNGGYRWLTVGLESQPDIEFQLAALEAGGGLDQDEVTQLSRMIETGKLQPERLIGKRVRLEDAGAELAAMGDYQTLGISVIARF